MLAQSIIGMSRRRWQAERPFEGHTKESLRRKLQSPAVRDDATVRSLAHPSDDGSAAGLRFLYPYDATVFPRGLLAPLVQWASPGDSVIADADAIRLHLSTTSGAYSWEGTFARPDVLVDGPQGPFFQKQSIVYSRTQ